METNELFTSLMTAYMAQMDSAIKIAETISDHGKEEEVSPDSIVTGLVYRLMVPMEVHEMEESFQQGKQIVQDIEKNISEEDEDFDTDFELSPETDTQEHGDKVIISRKVKVNQCNCDICIKARTCLLNYRDYEPNDQLAQRFKDAIDNACNVHQLMI
uniref:Uncharacterized protein n=1 Tax=viral metagenome TaxID=1070528 RepID=A0A6C0KZE1_9ZZZZ|tara:strand:+ start:9887 stop:10360 length:474 start_codon:yes stop_codon:yes gene_type:complete